MAKNDKKQSQKKSPAKEQSLRDYAGLITVYAVVVTIILIIMILKDYFGIDIMGQIGNLFQGVGAV